MFDSLNSIITTLCIGGALCCGALGIVLFLVWRVVGGSFLIPAISAVAGVLNLEGGLGSILGGGDDEDEDDGRSRRSNREAAATSNRSDRIRSRVQAADDTFDQALRSQRSDTPPNPNDPRSGTSPNDLGDTERWRSTLERRRTSTQVDGSDIPPNRTTRRRRVRGDDADDGGEVFGGAFGDEDGDGVPDLLQ